MGSATSWIEKEAKRKKQRLRRQRRFLPVSCMDHFRSRLSMAGTVAGAGQGRAGERRRAASLADTEANDANDPMQCSPL